MNPDDFEAVSPLQKVVHEIVWAAWCLLDDTANENPPEVPQDSWDKLASAMDAVKAYIPDSEQPCEESVCVRLLVEETRTALSTQAPMPDPCVCSECGWDGLGSYVDGKCNRCAPMPAASAEPVASLARVLATSDKVNFDEVCGYETEAEECNSSTCIAAHYEDHDPDWARSIYIRRAEAVLAALPALGCIAAPPVQAPMPREVGELVDKIAAALAPAHITRMGPYLHMAEVAFAQVSPVIQSLQQRVTTLEFNAAVYINERQQQGHLFAKKSCELTAAQRVKDEAVSDVREYLEAYDWCQIDPVDRGTADTENLRKLIAQHGGKHG